MSKFRLKQSKGSKKDLDLENMYIPLESLNMFPPLITNTLSPPIFILNKDLSHHKDLSPSVAKFFNDAQVLIKLS